MNNNGLLDPAVLRRLLAAGCPMPSESPDEPQLDLKIEVSRPEVSVAYDRQTSTEYVFGVRITNCTYSRLEFQRYRARLDWEAQLLWLGDPRIHMPETTVYRLQSGREFPCETVLNHRLGQHGALEPGESMEGMLLAFTIFERIPPDYIHGDNALANLSIMDQYGRRHSSAIEFSIDRRATMRPPVFRPRGRSLFDEPEPESRSIITPATDHAQS